MKRTGAPPSAPAPDPAATGYGGSSPFRLAREEPLVTRLLPITAEVPHYRVPSARRDLIAGVTVAALAIPSAMAYAEVAGLSPINGLYALLLPVVAYVIFGSSRQLVVGPDGSISTLVGAAIIPLAVVGSAGAVGTGRDARASRCDLFRGGVARCGLAGSPTTSRGPC